MNKHIDPNLSPETLQTYQGYSLQVFSSGRIKLSFHRSHKDRVEYYGECPKRHRDAYTNQHNRSVLALPQHFALVDDLLLRCPHSLIHRLHLKGDNNATADNAHVITDTDDKTCHVVLNTVHHQWALPAAVVHEMLSRSGPKRGQPLASTSMSQATITIGWTWYSASPTIGVGIETIGQPNAKR